MFGMGMGEIVLIAIVALLVLGPERLPGAARAIGKGIRDLRMQTKDLQQTIEKDTQIGDAVRELRGALRGDPETLYERATGERFSDSLSGVTDKKKQSSAGADKAALPASSVAAKTDESKTETDKAEAGKTEEAKPSDPSPSSMASSETVEANDGEGLEPTSDPDSDSFEPVIRSAPGAVARSDEDGDNSSHG